MDSIQKDVDCLKLKYSVSVSDWINATVPLNMDPNEEPRMERYEFQLLMSLSRFGFFVWGRRGEYGNILPRGFSTLAGSMPLLLIPIIKIPFYT